MFTVTQNGTPLEVGGKKIRGRDLQAVTLRAFQHATKVCRALSETVHVEYTGEDPRKVGAPNTDLGYPRWEITARVPPYVIVDDKTGEEAARITPRFYYVESWHVVRVERTSKRTGRTWREDEEQMYTGTRFSLTTEVKPV